jgi:hypothetical protein
MTIQWTYEDFVTKGPLVENVLSWGLVEVETNRGTYNHEWPVVPPFVSEAGGKLFKFIDDVNWLSGESQAMQDASETSISAIPDHDTFVSGTAGSKWRVPDSMMKIAPRTRKETIKVLTFYNHASTKSDATTVAQVVWNSIVDWYVVT